MISPLVRHLWLQANVPPPSRDEDLWLFVPGQLRMLTADPDCYFRVDRIHDGFIEGTQLLNREVLGALVLNQPCCVLQRPEDGVPIIALTLRKIEPDKAYIQVSAFTTAGDGIRIMTKQ